MMNKILIYTAITGSYEALKQPAVVDKDFDFLCFVSKGMKKAEYDGVWRIEEIPYEWDDMTQLARSQKLNPHTVLPPSYDFSLWIDGNISILDSSIYDICRDLAARHIRFAGIKHPFRDCVYEEMERVLCDRRETLGKLLRLATFLVRRHYPRHAGLMETNLIFRCHVDDAVAEFDRWWWECLIKYSNRDQLTQGFAMMDTPQMQELIDNGLVCNLLPEGMSARNFPGLAYSVHKSGPEELSWWQRKCLYGLNKPKTWILRAYIFILKLVFPD